MIPRSASGRGKKFLDAIYDKLGRTEIDDQAAGVRSLRDRPYVDAGRVGIYGTSYGGYASILCLLRHPDTFQAACASSPVTDYRHYDTIYTERYLRTPQENKEGYDAGSAVVHAADLKGRLMLYYGTADNNVHPANTLQLVQALQRAGKSFELQVGPRRRPFPDFARPDDGIFHRRALVVPVARGSKRKVKPRTRLGGRGEVFVPRSRLNTRVIGSVTSGKGGGK